MNPATSQEEQPLRAQIDEVHEKLGGLQQDLRAIDGELESLATQREQYRLLDQTCGSLEQLSELGVAELFWGQEADQSTAAEHVRRVRQCIDVFREQLAKIEDRRQSVVDEIKQGQEVLDILEEDLDEVRRQEEERQLEWIVEREDAPLPARPLVMPWMRSGEDDKRYRKSLASSLLVGLLIGLLLPLIDLPLPERAEIIEVPERLARLIRQEQLRPVPPAQPIIEEPRPEEQPPEPEPVLAEEPPPEPQPTQEPQPREQPRPAVAEQEAPRQRAESSGILAFRESFSSLAEGRPSARLGSDARISTAGDAAIGRPERSMVTTQAPGSSGGINIASLSRDVGGGGAGGGQIAGVETTRVASSIGGGGTGDRPSAGGGGASAGRTDEEIQIVFDRYKAALYRLYNRELRRDPTLRGQMVLRLTIEPSGSVSMVELQSTDMNAPDLATQVVERVRTFDFGAKDVPAITILYPIDFLPAA